MNEKSAVAAEIAPRRLEGGFLKIGINLAGVISGVMATQWANKLVATYGRRAQSTTRKQTRPPEEPPAAASPVRDSDRK